MGRGGENISTHAPLAGRDRLNLNVSTRSLEFQPTRPLRGATLATGRVVDIAVFQPTRPLRGATITGQLHRAHRGDFNPRAPCGARQNRQRLHRQRVRISTHAPLAGRDPPHRADLVADHISTHAPLAGRDGYRRLARYFTKISTHAPLAGRDRDSM